MIFDRLTEPFCGASERPRSSRDPVWENPVYREEDNGVTHRAVEQYQPVNEALTQITLRPNGAYEALPWESLPSAKLRGTRHVRSKGNSTTFCFRRYPIKSLKIRICVLLRQKQLPS